MVKNYKTKNLRILRHQSIYFLFENWNKLVLTCSLILLVSYSFGQKSFTNPPDEASILNNLQKDSTDLLEKDFSDLNTEVVAGIQYDTSYVGKKLRKKGQKLILFGYARMFAYGRNMIEPYPNLDPYERAYGFGDGYREPMLSLSMFGRPNGKSTFGTELFIFTPFTGSGYEENVLTLNLGLNFYGNFRTQHGTFGVRAGGIHWYNLSSFTVGVYQVLDRFSIFDRTPWEGPTDTDKYENYFETGTPNPGDLRWNNQAFQGLIVNGGNLPGKFNFDLFWGKTQPNGGLPNGIIDGFESIPPTLEAGSVPTYLGFSGDARYIPNFITGGKIGKTFGKKRNSISYNLIHSQTALDSLRRFIPGDSFSEDSTLVFEVPKRIFQVHSLALNLDINDVKVVGEFAYGSYESPTYEREWGEALMVQAFFPKEMTYLPIDVQLYQISQDFFNPNGAIATNSNIAINNDFGIAAGANGVGGQISLVNQLVHGRRGVNINTGYEVGQLKFNLGWGLAHEFESASSVITYVHRINGLALSRIYNPFPAGATGPTIFGPYGDKFSFFRGVSAGILTTDLDPVTALPLNKKYYNSLDLQGKYKTMVMDKPLYVFYLGSFGSASSKASLFPTLNDNSYLFVQYHELDVYYELFPKFVLTGYLGIENSRGGQFTAWDANTQLPLDQLGTGIGLGFDWLIAKNTGLYFRHRWMNFEDRSFELDTYKGREVTIELKAFF